MALADLKVVERRSLIGAVSSSPAIIARLQVILPGSYAWLATVAIPAMASQAALTSRISAAMALVALWVGPWLKEPLSRVVGIFGFVGFSALCWVFLRSVLDVERVEPLRAALGTLGWMSFGFGWGAVRRVGEVPEQGPHALGGPPLRPRQRPNRSSVVVFAIGSMAAVLPIVLAFGVRRPQHALFAHAVAIVCAIALVCAAADISIRLGTVRKQAGWSERVNRGTRPLAVLGFVLIIGFSWILLK